MRILKEHVINPVNDVITVTVIDEPGQGGASHEYAVTWPNDGPEPIIIKFQNGPIAEYGVNGLTHEVLLVILIDRLRCFKAGAWSCRENEIALTACEKALMWLQKRTRDRMARGVEGTNSK